MRARRNSLVHYRLVATVGGKGTGDHQFRSTLRGVSVDASRRIYAVGDREVKVFDADDRLLRRWPTAHPGISVAVSADGRVFVGEPRLIEIFSEHGKRLNVWRDNERLGLVTAIDFFADEVFVADARAPCIRKYDRNGEYLAAIGDSGRRRGFSVPNGFLDFCLDRQGVIHAANPGKHRVETYSREGAILGRFGHFGMHDPAHFRGCCNPTNIAVSGDGLIVVTEKAGPRVKVYDSDGRLLAVFGEALFDPGCKHMDIAVDREGRLYVVDTVRLKVCVFEKTPREGSENPENGVLDGAKRDE